MSWQIVFLSNNITRCREFSVGDSRRTRSSLKNELLTGAAGSTGIFQALVRLQNGARPGFIAVFRGEGIVALRQAEKKYLAKQRSNERMSRICQIGLIAGLLWGAAAVRAEPGVAPPAYDFSPPEIATTSAPSAAMPGTAVGIEAEVVDDMGLDTVTLHYRRVGEEEFRPILMDRIERGRYRARLASDAVREPGIEYFIEARDSGGNIVLRGNRTTPLHIAVALPGESAPAADSAVVPPEAARKPSYWKWVVGAVVIGAVAALAQGGGDGGGDGGDRPGASTTDPPPPGTVNVTITNPPWPEP